MSAICKLGKGINFTKFEFEKFFSLFYIISTQRSYIYKKPDTNRCFAKLRAISNLFSFFLYTLYIKFIDLPAIIPYQSTTIEMF
jgi:hypothetical protein